MIRLILLSLLTLLVVQPARASDTDWIAECKLISPGILDTSPVATKLMPGQAACYQANNIFDKSDTLNVSQCGTVMISQWNNANEDGSFAILSTRIFICPNADWGIQSCWHNQIPQMPAGNVRSIELGSSRFLALDILSGLSGVDNFYEVLCHK